MGSGGCKVANLTATNQVQGFLMRSVVVQAILLGALVVFVAAHGPCETRQPALNLNIGMQWHAQLRLFCLPQSTT